MDRGLFYIVSLNEQQFIGFPPPLLGEEAHRLPVVFDNGSLIALEKPHDVAVYQDNWYSTTPVLIEAIRFQAEAEKGELVRLKVSREGLFATYDVDPEVAGLVLFSRKPEEAEAIRNDLGSGLVTLEYHLLCSQAPQTESILCDLPLTRHFKNKRMIVSHQTGKQSETHFEKIEDLGRFSLWKATTRFVRRHQIAIHANESGLRVLGNKKYGNHPELFLSEIKRGYRPRRNHDERPLYPSISIVQKAVKLADGQVIEAPYPAKFSIQLKQLRKLFQ